MDRDGIELPGGVTIPEEEIGVAFGPSSGPGGQHVNRSETRVELRFDIARSPSLPVEVKRLLLERLASRVDTKGVLVVTSQRTRSQHRNRRDAFEKLARLLRSALAPRRVRRKTKPSAGARERRLEEKKRRSRQKRERRSPREED